MLVELPAVAASSGHEQIGTRPALVIHDNATIAALPVVMIIPFTSNPSVSRFPHVVPVDPSIATGLSVPSFLMVFQLRAIDKARIRRRIGAVDVHIMQRVNEEVTKILGIS